MSDSANGVVQKFNQAAQVYDSQRRKLIPCFNDFYNIAVSITESENRCPRIFINADQILGNTKFIDAMYKKDWETKVELSGLPSEDILSAYSDVDCIYKYFNFVVLFGRKIESN